MKKVSLIMMFGMALTLAGCHEEECPESFSPLPEGVSCSNGMECQTHGKNICFKFSSENDDGSNPSINDGSSAANNDSSASSGSDSIQSGGGEEDANECPIGYYILESGDKCPGKCEKGKTGKTCAKVPESSASGDGLNCQRGFVTLLGSKTCSSAHTCKDGSSCDSKNPCKDQSRCTPTQCVKGKLFGYCAKSQPDMSNDRINVMTGQRCTPKQLKISPESLVVHVIDVGQGDSIWVQTPDKKNILIDAGDSGAFGKSDGGNIVANYLMMHGFKPGSTFDTVVVTHPHADHYGGMMKLFGTGKKYTMNYYIDSGSTSKILGSSYKKWVGVAQRVAKKISYVPAEDKLTEGQFLTPEMVGNVVKVRYLISDKSQKDLNNSSVVLRFEYAGKSVLLTGDMEKELEAKLISMYKPSELSANFYKVCHHGSNTSSTDKFLKEMFTGIPEDQRYAFISSGHKPFSGSYIPTVNTIQKLRRYLPVLHLLSTSAGDGSKREVDSSRDDNILAVIKKDGSMYVCYSGPN